MRIHHPLKRQFCEFAIQNVAFRGRADALIAGRLAASRSSRSAINSPFSAFRQATETDTGGSMALGLAMRRLERLAVQRLYRQSLDRHRLAPERLSPVLGLEAPTRSGPAGGA